jgi:hypothetical protein
MKIFYISAFLTLLISNVFLLFKYRKSEEQRRFNTVKADNFIQLYHDKLLLQVQNSGAINFSTDSVIYDLTGSQTLGSVIDAKKLIFRFTELNCPLCIEQEIPTLKEIAKKIGDNNIIILASYDRPNALRILIDKYKLNFQAFNIPSGSLVNNEIESVNMPYYFMLGKSMIGKNIFIPEKTLPELTRDYLNLISESYTKK